jgi:hypothetical protein
MKTGNPDPLRDELRAWAAEQIGVSAEASAAEARGALLRALPGSDFLPAPGARAAVRILCGTDPEAFVHSPAVCEARREREALLRGDVEQFASDFFRTPPPERQARWQALWQRAASCAAVRARLTALQPGLKVEAEPLPEDDPPVCELGEHLQELFVLAPAARAARRRELIDDFAESIDIWEDAAKRVARKVPALVGLESELPERLRSWQKTQIGLDRRRRQDARRIRAGQPRVSAPAQTGGGKSGSWAWVAVLIGLALGGIRGAMSTSNNASNYSSPSVPNFQASPYQEKRGDEVLRQLEQQRPVQQQANPSGQWNEAARRLLQLSTTRTISTGRKRPGTGKGAVFPGRSRSP